jgi:hypothetical protein
MNSGPVRDQVDELRALLADPREVCRRLGLDDGARTQTRGLLVRCPWHSDRTPSCSVREAEDGTIGVKCFGCGRTGDVLHLVAAAHDLDLGRDFPAVLRAAAEVAGVRLENTPLHSGKRLRQAPPPRDYPPSGEVASVWAACSPVLDDPEVARWLRWRGLDPEAVDLLGLARALPASISLPRWARLEGRDWTAAGYRCLLPLFDGSGAMRSLRARRLTDRPGAKAVSPAGCRLSGLVLAEALGRALLAGVPTLHRSSEDGALRIVIAEGEPDFLTWATRFSDADADAPAVLGIVSGSWAADVADRIPDGAVVLVWCDDDEAGDRYARAIYESLHPRCEVLRCGTE